MDIPEAENCQYDGKDWNPDDPLLGTPGPHEVGGVLRIKNTGMPGSEITTLLGVRATALLKEMQQAVDDREDAARAGRPIYDAMMPKEAC